MERCRKCPELGDLGAFAVEAVVMLAIVPQRWRWIRTHPLEVAIVLLTPPFLPPSLQALRVFRLLRLIPLLRLARVARHLFSLEGVAWAALLAVLITVFAAAAYSSIEEGASTWDGVWWAVSTITTVGYGDEFPKTDMGRALGMALMVIGIGFVAVLTGALAGRFLAARIEETQEELSDAFEEAELDVLGAPRDRGAVEYPGAATRLVEKPLARPAFCCSLRRPSHERLLGREGAFSRP
jgi:voltage-gated potassium channel